MRPTIGTVRAVRRDNERRDIDFGIAPAERDSTECRATDVLIATTVNG